MDQWLVDHMRAWRQNAHTPPDDGGVPWGDVVDIFGIALLCWVLYVIVLLVMVL